MELYAFQKKLIKRILNKIDNTNLYMLEAPTGSGKSVITAFLIKELRKKYPDKKIIVSTHTIQLALELLHTFEKIKNNENYDIVIGKENYLDLKNLNFTDLSEFVENIEKVIKKINELVSKNKNKYLLIDLFLDELDIGEAEKEILKLELQTNNKKDYIKDFDEVDISFTNHFYLLSKAFYDKDFNLNEYIIIFDEFHLLSDSAETLYSYNFSIYRYLFLLKKLVKQIENEAKFTGQKTLLKSLYKHLELSKYVFNKVINKKLVGKSFINDEKYSIGAVKRLEKLAKDENIIKNLNKFSSRVSNETEKIINLFISENKELRQIISANPKEVAVYYSPSFGFPRFSVTKGNVKHKLKYSLWDRLDKAVGMSATLTIDKNDSDFIEKRLGLDLSGIKRYFYKKEPIFSIKQINYEFADKTFPKPDRDEINISEKWVEAIANKVKDTFENKNTMIITGGFLEVDAISDKLKELLPNVNILKAERKKSAVSVINEFKEKGGILVATRNYGTGVDLKGEKLEKLYIAKLPYPVITNKKWIDLKNYDKLSNTNMTFFLMENEMLLNLKQYIGRLIRSKEDKGDLYILDSRVHKNYRKERIETMIKNSFKS